MLLRSLFIVGVVGASVVATATDAEARRFRLFSSPARAATPPAVKPDAVAPTAAVPAVPAAPASRSGTFVFIGASRSSGASAATPEAEEPARRGGEAVPMLATITDAPAKPPQERPRRPAVFSFETVSAPARGFEVVKPRDARSVRLESVPVASAPAPDSPALRR